MSSVVTSMVLVIVFNSLKKHLHRKTIFIMNIFSLALVLFSVTQIITSDYSKRSTIECGIQSEYVGLVFSEKEAAPNEHPWWVCLTKNALMFLCLVYSSIY